MATRWLKSVLFHSIQSIFAVKCEGLDFVLFFTSRVAGAVISGGIFETSSLDISNFRLLSEQSL